MKKVKFSLLFLTLIMIMVFHTACSLTNKAGNTSSEVANSAEKGNYTQKNTDELTEENTSHETTDKQNTPIILDMNGTEVKATLNNTLTAQEFIKLLPYSVTVSRAADDLCGSVSEDLPANSFEGKNGWKIGEIGWSDGWFTILVDHEENFSDMQGVMVIGKIDDQYIDIVTSFTGRVDIVIRLDSDTLVNKEDEAKMQMKVTANGKTIIFELNDSPAAKSLYDQLPMIIDVKNYSSDEKIFYPAVKLNTKDTPSAKAKKGTLAYYAPWGDVVMFYDDFGTASGLYELGYVVSGSQDIPSLSGTIQIERN